MSQFIKFYFTSSMFNMFRTLIHPPSGACDFSIVSPHCLCVLVSMCVGVSVWLVGVVSVWQAEHYAIVLHLVLYVTRCLFIFHFCPTYFDLEDDQSLRVIICKYQEWSN